MFGKRTDTAVVALVLGMLGTACRAQTPDRSAEAAPVADVSGRDQNAADALAPSTDAAADAPAPADAAAPADTGTGPAFVEFRPHNSRSIHTHGGEAAHLYQARFVVHNGGARAASVSVVRVEYLTGNSCDAPPSNVRSSPKAEGLSIGGAPPAARVAIPPGTNTPVTVEFAPVDAYYTDCNRFAFRVTFAVDGARAQSTAETVVSRVEPLRP